MGQGQVDMSRIPGELLALLVDPTSNLLAALVLYGIITVLLLIVVVGAILFLISAPDDEEAGEGEAGEAAEGRGPGVDAASGDADAGVSGGAGLAGAPPAGLQPSAPPAPRRPMLVTAWVVLVVAGVWLTTGVSTSTDALCVSCHLETPHTAAVEADDPHADTACVSCHEPGGWFGRYVGAVPARVTHLADGLMETVAADDYGRVTQAACASCHGRQIRGVTSNEDRGLKMSHAEPVEAGIRCVDCHRLSGGVVAGHDAGMNPCLRCHDSQQASAECETCHDKTAAAAARVRTLPAARPQVEQVRCGGCHDEKAECDSCHGTRMPHSIDFMRYAHARAGAVDIWYNGGRACAKCHTPERRPCQRCHTNILGRGHGTVMAGDHRKAAEQACNTCHLSWAYAPRRDFCLDLCHTEAAIAESPR